MFDLMKREFVQVIEEVSSWEVAIQKAAEPLCKAHYITLKYVDKMISNISEHGPYVVIMPKVALPHARAHFGVIKTGVSMLKLHSPVLFPENKEVQFIVVLAANDDEVHMQLLSDMVDLFMNEAKMNKVFDAKDEEELLGVL